MRSNGRGPYRKDYISVRRDGSGFQYKRAVPVKLQPLVGRTAWTRWLGNNGRATAEQKARELAVQHDHLIAHLTTLSELERNQIIAAGGIDAWQSHRRLNEMAMSAARAAADMMPDPEMPEDLQARTALEAHRARERAAWLQAEAVTAKRITRKIKGETDGNLYALVELHERVSAPRSYKTSEKARLYVGRFIEIVGDLAPQAVTRQHVIKFRDALEAQGFKALNVGQHLAKLHTLFNTAMSEGIVQSNPAHKIKARKSPGKLSEGKKGFDGAQSRRIFSALNTETADFQWIVKLLAYHGPRGSEICQLKCSDITTLHGVPVLRIHDRHGLLKNRQSVRDIPIHPKSSGIIAYAAKVAKVHGDNSWLFQSLTDSKQGRGHNWQNYANRKFLRERVRITDRAYSMHSFRHAFSTLCREVGMPDSIKYALMGHALGKGEGGKYGEGPSLKVRAKWIARIDPLNG
jgi:integrase